LALSFDQISLIDPVFSSPITYSFSLECHVIDSSHFEEAFLSAILAFWYHLCSNSLFKDADFRLLKVDFVDKNQVFAFS